MNNATKTWPDLAVGLYDRLTGRGSEITYELDNIEILVPDKVGDDADVEPSTTHPGPDRPSHRGVSDGRDAPHPRRQAPVAALGPEAPTPVTFGPD
jgi:hypothetical protein